MSKLEDFLSNITDKDLVDAMASFIKCTSCNGTGGSGQFFGGFLSITKPGHGSKEMPCRHCDAKGQINTLADRDISMIVAVSDNGVIGTNNKMPWHVPDDLKYFKKVTTGCTVIMGRKTLESIGKALPGRKNIVISRTVKTSEYLGARVESSIESAILSADSANRIMIIGGAEIYRQAERYAKRLYITRVHRDFAGDTEFPEMTGRWKTTSVDRHEAKIAFSFEIMERF